jgi:hypothetical protein
MKKNILAAAVVISLMITQACKTEVKKEEKKEEKTTANVKHNLTSSYRVPLPVAKENIQRYTDKCAELFGMTPIKAYTIHAEDLLEVLGIPVSEPPIYEYSHVRAYLGLDSLNNFKLYLTPVVGANLSAVPKVAGTDVILQDEDGKQYVLDLNAPCPATCDITSPLYCDKLEKK